MFSVPKLIEWRTWRWRAVVSGLTPTTRSFSLRELLDSLEMYRNRTNSPHLRRLIALLKEDLATAARYPERRGAPDTRRTLGGWRQRYNHLDQYLTLEIAGAPDGRQAIFAPDDCNTQALSRPSTRAGRYRLRGKEYEMGNEWTSGIERARESDCHVAALLTSALIARATHPCGTGAELEAANAVNLYRCVLAALAQGERDRLVGAGSPTRDSANMQALGVSRDGVKYRYKTFLYDKLDDALNYARIDRERVD